MREMEGPAPGGRIDGSNHKGFRRTPASLHDLLKGAERCSGTRDATGRAFAARGARSGATSGFPSAGVCRGRGSEWSEPRPTVAGMDAGLSYRGNCGGDDWGDDLPPGGANDLGRRTRGRSEANRMASSQRCSAGGAGARDFADDAETRRVVSECPREKE